MIRKDGKSSRWEKCSVRAENVQKGCKIFKLDWTSSRRMHNLPGTVIQFSNDILEKIIPNGCVRYKRTSATAWYGKFEYQAMIIPLYPNVH